MNAALIFAIAASALHGVASRMVLSKTLDGIVGTINSVAMLLFIIPMCWKACPSSWNAGKWYPIAAGCVAVLTGIVNLACYSYEMMPPFYIPDARKYLIMGIVSGVIWFVPAILYFWYAASGREAAAGNNNDDDNAGDVEEGAKPVGKAADDASAESEEDHA